MSSDPRAELARVQRARETADRPRLVAREAALFAKHGERWRAPLAKLEVDHLTYRRGEVVRATVMVESAAQLARVLALAPKLETLSLNFASRRLTPATIRTLFDVPALAQLDELELGGGTPEAAYDRFFASPHTRGVRRVAIGGEHAARFARVTWSRLEHLAIYLDHSAADRKALARILATPLPHLATLALHASALSSAGVDLVARSPAYPRLRGLELHELEPGLDDAAITALGRRATALATLRLSIAGVTAKGLASLARLARRLERLDLADGPLDAPRLARLAKVPNLVALGFWGAPDADALRALLAVTPRLEKLVLGHALTAGAEHCDAIATARRLRALAITDAPLGAAAATLGKLANLETLELNSSRIGDAGAAGLLRLRRLREVGLEFCGIGNAGGAALARWPATAALQAINVNGNHILDKRIQGALKQRFAWVHPIALIGYQHAVPDPTEVDDEPEPPPPRQRPHRALPPRRRDWRAGLRELVGRPHFASWDGYVDAALIARSEALIDRCARALLALGEAAAPKAQRAALRRCVTGFNRFSDRIHTIEAETILDTFDAIARYTTLADADGLADDWRDF